jgi:hypothetical protein
MKNYANHVKINDVTRETGEIRRNQLRFEGLASQSAAPSNRIRISANVCETRSAGNMDLVSCDNLWRNLVLEESLIPSGEKVSVFRIELQQERERLLYCGVFGAAPIPTETVGQKWYFLGQALFDSRSVETATFIFSKSKEAKDSKLVVCPRAALVVYHRFRTPLLNKCQSD